jgi:hypothetical protein
MISRIFIYLAFSIYAFTQPLQAIHCPVEQLPNQIKINVVYIPQNDHKSCATTSVAMAISHYEGLDNQPLDKEIIWKMSGTDEDTAINYGNDMAGLERIAKHYGYKSEYADNLTFYDLEFLLSKGILVVVNIKEKKPGSAFHAVLLTGYDRVKKSFYIEDPANASNQEMSYGDLAFRWIAYLSYPRGMSYRSGFIIYPKA